MSVADGGEGLHAEKEGRRKGAGWHLRDRVAGELIQEREDDVKGKIATGEKGGETRPTQRQDPMVRVPPVAFAGIDLQKLELTDVNDHSRRFFLHEAGPKVEWERRQAKAESWDERLRNGLTKTKQSG